MRIEVVSRSCWPAQTSVCGKQIPCSAFEDSLFRTVGETKRSAAPPPHKRCATYLTRKVESLVRTAGPTKNDPRPGSVTQGWGRSG